ncbi:hypothetical protein EJB05_35211, partial [Eragrostis curvula]
VQERKVNEIAKEREGDCSDEIANVFAGGTEADLNQIRPPHALSAQDGNTERDVIADASTPLAPASRPTPFLPFLPCSLSRSWTTSRAVIATTVSWSSSGSLARPNCGVRRCGRHTCRPAQVVDANLIQLDFIVVFLGENLDLKVDLVPGL